MNATPPPPMPTAAPRRGVGSLFHRLFRGVVRSFQRADWADFAGDDWLETIMTVDATDDFHAKQGRSTGRWAIDVGGRSLSVYLKRHYRLPLRHGIAAALFPGGDWSPAMQERRNLEWARAAGLLVPEVAAAAEWIGPGGKLQSMLAVDELVGMLALHQAIPLAQRQLTAVDFRRWKGTLAIELARQARLLHDRSRFHKDLYLCHFYVAREDCGGRIDDWQGRVRMIDLHRLARHPWTRPIWLLKDLGGLLFSSFQEGVDDRDRLRFWRAYCGPDRKSLRNRLLAWCIRRKGARYLRHNEKKA